MHIPYPAYVFDPFDLSGSRPRVSEWHLSPVIGLLVHFIIHRQPGALPRTSKAPRHAYQKLEEGQFFVYRKWRDVTAGSRLGLRHLRVDRPFSVSVCLCVLTIISMSKALMKIREIWWCRCLVVFFLANSSWFSSRNMIFGATIDTIYKSKNWVAKLQFSFSATSFYTNKTG